MSDSKKTSCLPVFLGWIAGIITGIGLIVFLIVSLLLNIGNQAAVVKNNSYLILDFPGEIVEKPQTESLTGNNQKRIELINYLYAIENASSDDKIKGIIINGDLISYGRAYNEEIGYSLERFKKSGKKIYAWFSAAENSSYNLCLYADKIYMPDTKSASLSLKGYSLNIPYLKDALDKIGVEFTVIHIGSYKDAFENYGKNSMSNEQRESYINILDDLYSQLIESISSKRKIEKGKLLNYFASGKTLSMTPDEAKEYGFIDEIKSYEDLKETLDKDFESISIMDYISSIKKSNLSTNKIAIIYVEGEITNYYTYDGSFEGSIVGAKSFIEDLNQVAKDKSVKAVILRVNSPGGSALAGELMLQEIQNLKKIKPVIVSFGPVAASGGYYISCAGNKIFTNPSTLTGSIGVVFLLMNYEKLMNKIGVNNEVIKKNKFDDIMSPDREPTDEEIELMKKSMLGIYGEFTDHVINERKIDKNKIDGIAEGRVWTGNQAAQNKLADEKGGLLDAIDYASKITNTPAYNLESFPKPESFFEKLSRLGEFTKLSIDDKQIKRLMELAVYYKINGKKASMLLPFYDLP